MKLQTNISTVLCLGGAPWVPHRNVVPTPKLSFFRWDDISSWLVRWVSLYGIFQWVGISSWLYEMIFSEVLVFCVIRSQSVPKQGDVERNYWSLCVDWWSLCCTLITLGSSVHTHNLSSYSNTWTAYAFSPFPSLRLSASLPLAASLASYHRCCVWFGRYATQIEILLN